MDEGDWTSTAKIFIKFSWESPNISKHVFSGVPKFHARFHLSKLDKWSSRHSTEFPEKPESDLLCERYFSLLKSYLLLQCFSFLKSDLHRKRCFSFSLWMVLHSGASCDTACCNVLQCLTVSYSVLQWRRGVGY